MSRQQNRKGGKTMKKSVFVFLCCMVFLTFEAGGTWAAQMWCVSNAVDLQKALNNAVSINEGINVVMVDNVIMVVQGTYTGNFTYNSNSGMSITLQGGYTAGCVSRVFNPAKTVLDGNHAGVVLLLQDNSGGNISVEEFTIRNGNNPIGSGGGVWANSSSLSGTGGTITLSGNTFTGNTADLGGGVRAFSYSDSGTGGTINLTENTFTGNYAYTSGGGVSASSNIDSGTGGVITLIENTITGNYAYIYGGGVFAYSDSGSGTGGTISLTENTITGNYAYQDGGGVWASSATNLGTLGPVTLAQNTISGNTAYGTTGGAGVYLSAYSDSGTGGTITLTGNTVANNHAYGDGGGVNCEVDTATGTTGPVTFEANTITGNIANGSSGGVYANAQAYSSGTTGAVTFTNNIIAANTSFSVGGIYAYSSSGSGATGAITLTNNTVTKNSDLTGNGGVEVAMSNNTFNCYNNIIWGNTAPSPADIVLSGTGTAYGYNNDYNAMYGSWNGGSAGNIDHDPLFDAFGYYHLASQSSPCINAGDNSAPGGLSATDIDGNNRVINSVVDIGAVEFNGLLIAKAPADGSVFTDGSIINKYQPTFQWIAVEPFTSFAILFSTSPTDFSTKGVFIIQGSASGTTSSWTPPIAMWEKIMATSYNNGGTVRPIYWKVMGTGANNAKTYTPVRQFSVGSASLPTILSPAYGTTLPAADNPAFVFLTGYNIKFRLEIWSLAEPTKIIAYTYTVTNPITTPVLEEPLSSSQWTAVKKLIGTNIGNFRIRAWDGINRESDSGPQPFTIQ
jgi:hypothetical protein